MKGLIKAIRTLTIIPVPGNESEDFSSSLPWFPFIGLILGLALYGVAFIWSRVMVIDWPEGGAVILVAAQVILTRGLHLDGLADWADAVGGHRQREKRLAIMKDPHVGAFGVLALIIVLMLKWVAFKRLLFFGSFIWLLPVSIISRGMMAELISVLPYARPVKGMAQPFVKDASPKQRVMNLTVSFCACLYFGPAGLLMLGAGWMIAMSLGMWYRRGFGGITGDLLGTANEIIETIIIMICALPGELILRHTGWGWLLS